jgi:hypothetical protein
MFFTVMVPMLSSLSLHFICEVHICCFSHVIHDDLLVLVSSVGLVFSPEEKADCFQNVVFVISDNEKSPHTYS